MVIVMASLTFCRVRYQVQSAQPPSFANEAKKLAELIKQYNLNEDSLFVN